MKNPAYTKKHWLIFIFVAMMMGSSLGLLTNGDGVFYAPMARDLNVYLGEISLHTTFKSFATAFATLTIPLVLDRFGLKKMIAFGVALATIGTLLMSFINSTWLIYLLGIVRGIGMAYYSLVPMAMILNYWFDKHNGLVTGLASGTSGIVAAISAPLLTLAIEQFGWRFAFLLKAIFILLLALPVIIYPFTLNPEDEGLLPYGYQALKETNDMQTNRGPVGSTRTYILLTIMVVALLNTLVMYFNSHFPGYGESIGLAPETASLLLSGAMLGNLSLKAVYGVLADRIGPVKASVVMLGSGFVSLSMLIIFRSPALLIVGSFLFGGIFAVSGVALSVMSNYFFGVVASGKVYSRASFFVSFGGAIGVGATGFIYDFTGSYIPAFVTGLVFIVINAFLLVTAERKFDRQRHVT